VGEAQSHQEEGDPIVSSITAIGPKSNRRYQVRWRTPEGEQRKMNFKSRDQAEQHLTAIDHAKRSGVYIDASAGDVMLDEFAREWIATRRTPKGQRLRPKVVALYEHQYDKHISPKLGRHAINVITPSMVRSWHGGLDGSTLPAKCYRLLRAIMN